MCVLVHARVCLSVLPSFEETTLLVSLTTEFFKITCLLVSLRSFHKVNSTQIALTSLDICFTLLEMKQSTT